MKLSTILMAILLLVVSCQEKIPRPALETRGIKSEIQAVYCSSKDESSNDLIEAAKRISQESLRLTAVEKEQHILIDWSIKENKQTKGFVLEKASKEKTYQAITTVKNDLEGISKHYSYIDHFPSDETIFYRLKQLYRDGTTALSQPLKIEPRNVRSSWLFIKRSETEPSLQIEFNLKPDQYPVLLYWYNDFGRKVKTQQIHQNPTKFSLPELLVEGGALRAVTANQEVSIQAF